MQGLQVFDGSGNLVFDATKRLSVILGQVALNANEHITVYSDGFSYGTAFIYSNNLGSDRHLKYSVSGNSMSIQYELGFMSRSLSNHPIANILYGVF